MGLLTQGKPLVWGDSGPYREKVKRDGVTQFLNAYAKVKGRMRDTLKWGDEVEYCLVKMTDGGKKAKLSLRATEVIAQLQQAENLQLAGEINEAVETLWRPEYATWMVEGTPGTPYRSFITDLTHVETNMALRRAQIESQLMDDEMVLTMTAYPRLGCKKFTEPSQPVFGKYARSFFTSDFHINPHPRFPTLTRNIRLRRGSKVDIHMPLYLDENTPDGVPIVCDSCDPECVMPPEEVVIEDNAYDTVDAMRGELTDDVYMDSMAFGMGCSCLQVTLQARDVDECRHLYDQLNVLSPIMLALTASSPAMRGYLLDTDARWNIIAASVDDRTPEERAGKISKSRYDSIDMYISKSELLDPDRYNDVPVALNLEAYDRLIEGGIDDRLAQHIAHLFVRDPLVIFEDRIDLNNETEMDHFENIQSTNWNTVRFKPPHPDSDIGWRAEFRSMEVQVTDFENAAFSVFIVLVSRVILAFNLNLYMPISKVDENMQVAHERNAAESSKFYFRANIFEDPLPDGCQQFSWCPDPEECASDPCAVELLSINDIINGTPLKADGCRPAGLAFPGLIPLVKSYLHALQDSTDVEAIAKVNKYLDFVSARAKGELWTTAKWMRNFILKHPSYAEDSRVSDEITADLVRECHQVSRGEKEAPELLGPFSTRGNAFFSAKDFEALRTAVASGDGMLRGASMSYSTKERAFREISRNHA